MNFELMPGIFVSHHSTAIKGSSLTEEESRLLIVNTSRRRRKVE
ncbi:hypothetical protein [Bacteroides acidifaciens]|nr:hypothetical protein [Bacteroides acidifaciens]